MRFLGVSPMRGYICTTLRSQVRKLTATKTPTLTSEQHAHASQARTPLSMHRGIMFSQIQSPDRPATTRQDAPGATVAAVDSLHHSWLPKKLYAKRQHAQALAPMPWRRNAVTGITSFSLQAGHKAQYPPLLFQHTQIRRHQRLVSARSIVRGSLVADDADRNPSAPGEASAMM